MKFRKPLFLYFALVIGSVVTILSTSAWFQIQAVRLGYKIQKMHYEIEELKKKEQRIDGSLQRSLSLAHLDRLAKTRYHLQVPQISQIVLISDGKG